MKRNVSNYMTFKEIIFTDEFCVSVTTTLTMIPTYKLSTARNYWCL